MKLEGKTALVTGGASGFGRGIAQVFAENGARVAIVDLDTEGAEKVASEIGNGAIALTCDVSDGEAVSNAVSATVEAFGKMDIAVNNAGFSHDNKPLLEVGYEEFRKVYAVNVDSIYHMTHAALPHWREIGGGVMINIGSTAGIRPRPGLTWYNSSKGAVNLMTKALAIELAPDNVRVCGLAPVIGATALLETFMGKPDTPENREKFIQTIPLGRLCEAHDVADAALFLASGNAEFITGCILEIDGGRCI